MKLLRKGQLYSLLYSVVDRHMRSLVQALEEGYRDRMDK